MKIEISRGLQFELGIMSFNPAVQRSLTGGYGVEYVSALSSRTTARMTESALESHSHLNAASDTFWQLAKRSMRYIAFDSLT